jgi:predicted nuclease of restriction endonuclease-like (RecB) superfamily
MRLWYVRQAVEFGWSRNVLVHQIESRLFERQGNVPNARLSELFRQLSRELTCRPST